MVELAGSKFLVTGATGFVGNEVARQLLERGANVRLLVRDTKRAEALAQRGAEIVQGDLTTPDCLAHAVSGVQGVFHIAALYRQASFPDEVYYQTNAEGTRHLIRAAREAGVARFIHCSTIGVLGDVDSYGADENSPYAPGDVYQESKLAGEKIALEAFGQNLIRGVVIRPAMIYGPGDTRFLKLFRMVAKGVFFYVGAGDKLCHFIDVRDLARAFLTAMERDQLNGEVYIIAGEKPVPLRDFVETVARQLGVRSPWLRLPVKPMQLLGDFCEAICVPFGIEPPIFRRRVDFFTKNRSFRTDKAQRDLDFHPAQALDSEVRDMIEWYVRHGMLSSGATRFDIAA